MKERLELSNCWSVIKVKFILIWKGIRQGLLALIQKPFSISLLLLLCTLCLGEKSLPLNVGLGRGKNNSGTAKECNIAFKVFQEHCSGTDLKTHSQSQMMWKLKEPCVKSNNPVHNVKKVKGKLWHSQMTYIYPLSLIMRETDYIFYTEIPQLGGRDQDWKTDSAQICVEVCGSMPETEIQSCKVLAPLPERQSGIVGVWFCAYTEVMHGRRQCGCSHFYS